MWVSTAVSLWGQQDNSNLGGLYIPAETSMTIFGNLNFSEGAFNRPGIITTYKHPTKKGIIHFAQSSHWFGTSDNKFIDGYAGSFHQDAFVFPIGGEEIYKPIAVFNSYGSFAAYYPESSFDIGSQVSPALDRIMEHEYWHISIASDSKISLTWGHDSTIDELIREESLDNLTIVAFKDDLWYPIESSVDEYTIDVTKDQLAYGIERPSKKSGSITTSLELVAGEYEFFTLGQLAIQDEEEQIVEFTMSPNPQVLEDQVNISYDLPDTAGGQLYIFSSNNQLTHSEKITDQAGSIIIDSFKESGSYIVGIQDSQGKVKFKNIIIVD